MPVCKHVNKYRQKTRLGYLNFVWEFSDFESHWSFYLVHFTNPILLLPLSGCGRLGVCLFKPVCVPGSCLALSARWGPSHKVEIRQRCESKTAVSPLTSAHVGSQRVTTSCSLTTNTQTNSFMTWLNLLDFNRKHTLPCAQKGLFKHDLF